MRSTRAAGSQTGFEARPSTSGGRAGAPDALRVATSRTAGEAGRGDGNSYPGAGRLAPRPALTEQVPDLIPDPAIWYQRRPGGPWYRIGREAAHHFKTCEMCGQQFLARYRARFCSRSCQGSAHRSGVTTITRPSGPDHPQWRGDDASYQSVHRRVYRARGPASALACIDCGKSAQHWSRTHGTTGLQPDHYEPRCIRCHRDYDLELLARGERHGCSKLTAAQVTEIRALWESEQIPGHRHRRGCGHTVQWTQAALGARFGVGTTTVNRIVCNQIWRIAR